MTEIPQRDDMAASASPSAAWTVRARVTDPDASTEMPGVDANVPGVDANVPGVDANAPGVDANAPGVDANAPGVDANAMVSSGALEPASLPQFATSWRGYRCDQVDQFIEQQRMRLAAMRARALQAERDLASRAAS